MKNPSETQLSMLSARAHALMRPLAPLACGSDGTLCPQSREQFAALSRAILRRNRAVGASIVLLSPGGAQDVFCFGHARLSPRMPVTPDTCFRVASVSKLVLSFGALSLVESGLWRSMRTPAPFWATRCAIRMRRMFP